MSVIAPLDCDQHPPSVETASFVSVYQMTEPLLAVDSAVLVNFANVLSEARMSPSGGGG